MIDWFIYLVEKDLADPVQITKDVERSLYYYPQGNLYLKIAFSEKKKIKRKGPYLYSRCITNV